jgi:hypothetical protein
MCSVVVTEYINARSKVTWDRVVWLLELESRPRTWNTPSYTYFHDKFLGYYRGGRRSDDKTTLIRKLESQDKSPTTKNSRAYSSIDADFNKSVVRVLSGLTEVGISCKAVDLPKLLPSDPFEPALHIMATVRAYFQGKYFSRSAPTF